MWEPCFCLRTFTGGLYLRLPHTLHVLTPGVLAATDMNLGDAPIIEGPALAPGYAPAPQAEINAAIAAEEAPTPQEKAVTNPVTNVISALLTGRKLQQQPGQQQPGPQQQAGPQQQQQPGAGTPPTEMHCPHQQ